MADWNAIRIEYITTKTSYRKLSEKYGINKDVIARKARNDGWQADRDKIAAKVHTKTINKLADKEANRLAKLMDATNKAADVAMVALDAQQSLAEEADTRALRDLTAVIKDLTGLMRDFYNIPTPAQREAQRIAGERLRLEQLKAEADKNDDKEVEVLFVGEDMGDLSG